MPRDPASPAMRAAWQLKDQGDVAGACREARRILESGPPPEERAQAEELLTRASTPLALYGFAALALLVLGVLLTLVAVRY